MCRSSAIALASKNLLNAIVSSLCTNWQLHPYNLQRLEKVLVKAMVCIHDWTYYFWLYHKIAKSPR